MYRPDLNRLPEMPALPSGYALRLLRENEDEALRDLLQRAFPELAWTQKMLEEELRRHPNVDRTFIIDYAGVPVATATALLEPETNPGAGVLHWVAAHPDHRGKRLGYCVSLAVLHRFVTMGCTRAKLNTDAYRLAAIQTYVHLGFQQETSS